MNRITTILLSIIILQIGINTYLFSEIKSFQKEMINAINQLNTENPDADPSLKVGIEIPSFSPIDINDQPVSLENKQKLMIFSATDCNYCKIMYPKLKNMMAANDLGIQVLMFSYGPVEDNKKLMEEYEFPFPVLPLSDEIGINFRVPSTPFFYLVNEENIIVAKGTFENYSQIKALIHQEKQLS